MLCKTESWSGKNLDIRGSQLSGTNPMTNEEKKISKPSTQKRERNEQRKERKVNRKGNQKNNSGLILWIGLK